MTSNSVFNRLKSLLRGGKRNAAIGIAVQNWDRSTGSQAFSIGNQVLRGALLPVLAGDVITNVLFRVETAGTPTNFYAALYSTTGALLASSNSSAAAGTAVGDKTLPLSTPYRVPADGVVYAAVLSSGSTPPSLLAGRSQASAMSGFGSGVGPAVSQTGQATLPAPATFVASSAEIWVGVS